MCISCLRPSRAISAALAALTACSAICASASGAFAAGSSFLRYSTAIGRGPRLMSRSVFNPLALGKPLIFDADETQNVIDIYLQTPPNTMVGQISESQPVALATDVSGDLYVTNANAPNIPVFAPPYTHGPTRILQTNGDDPYGVAVSSEGLVAALNYSEQNGTIVVSFYAKGATMPCNNVPITDPGLPLAISFDRAGDAFLGGQISNNPYAPYVAEIKGGCAAKKAELLTAKNKLDTVLDVHVNKNNEVAMLDDSTGNIYTYKLPVNGSLGNPVSTTAIPYAGDFTFVASGLDLFASLGTPPNSYMVTKFTYPGGKIEESFNQPSFGTVAAWPPLVP